MSELMMTHQSNTFMNARVIAFILRRKDLKKALKTLMRQWVQQLQ